MKTNLFKKMTSLFLAAMMLMSVVPMMASAEVSDGKFWQTISVVNMDGFTQNDPADEAMNTNNEYEMWQGTKTATGTLGERTVHLETTTNSNYGTKMKKPSWKIKYDNTGICSLSETMLANKPVAVGDGYFVLHRGYDGGFPAPDASINLTNIFDEADVQVGDNVKITVYVWTKDTYQIPGGGADSVPAEDVTNTTFSLWVSEGSTGQGLTAKEHTYSADTVTNAKEGEYITTAVTNNQWNEVTLEYTITDENKLISSIQMNNDNKAHDVEYYPLELRLGAVKVEKLAEPNGKYTIEDGKKWESVNEFDFDGFVEETRDAYNYTHTYAETINDVKHTLNIYAIGGKLHDWSDLIDVSDADGYGKWDGGVRAGFYSLPSVVKNPSAAKLGHVRRAYITNKGFTSPYSGFSMPEIYGAYTPQVGDKVRVSVYVYPTSLHTWDEEAKTATEDTEAEEAEMTMWLSSVTDGSEYYPTHPTGNSNSDEYISQKINVGQWNKVTLEYDITDANAGVRGINMYNAPMNVGTTWVFPTQMLIAGVTVEKLVDDVTEKIGKITGTAVAAPATVEDGADYRVLVGAYNVVDGEYMMLGCNILPYEADNSYDFVINDAVGTTDVFAYLWDFNSFEPQLVPIECTYIAQ